MNNVALNDLLGALLTERQAVEVNLGDGRSLVLLSRNEYQRLLSLTPTKTNKGQSKFPSENGTYVLKDGVLTKVK